jgi:hypothetical protein
LPKKNRPEEKLNLDSESIHHLATDSNLLNSIRAFGGEIASADELGNFAAVLPDADEYFVLALVEQDSSPMIADTRTLAELGRYFLYGDQILTRFAWSWSSETVYDGATISIEL